MRSVGFLFCPMLSSAGCLKLVDDVGDNTPNHRLVKVTDLHVGVIGLSAVNVIWPSTTDKRFTVISPLIAAITTLPALGSMLLSTTRTSPSLMCGSIERPDTRQKKVAISLVISSSLRSIFSADSPNGGWGFLR